MRGKKTARYRGVLSSTTYSTALPTDKPDSSTLPRQYRPTLHSAAEAVAVVRSFVLLLLLVRLVAGTVADKPAVDRAARNHGAAVRDTWSIPVAELGMRTAEEAVVLRNTSLLS